jgi:hypothetical protein
MRAAILDQSVRDELRFGEGLSASEHEARTHEERTLSHSPQEGTLKSIFT